MSNNYLKQHIESFLLESTAINANLHVVNSFMVARVEQLKELFPMPQYNGYALYSMISTYRDLSQVEGGNNLYETGGNYNLTAESLDSESLRLLSYVSCLTITQIFEVFESFLKNMLSEIICQNPHLLKLLKLEPAMNDFNGIRDSLWKIQGNNNKGFIKVIRKISPFFKNHEKNNIWKRNVSEWFNLIAIIRHLVIHKRQRIENGFIESLNKTGLNSLFKRHFSITSDLLILTPYEANAIIDHLYEYGHLIYKGISNDFGLQMDFRFNAEY